jgi:DNA polymerase phi
MSSEVYSKKRRREPFNVDVKQVEIYEDLANEKDEVRLKAAHELVSRFTPESKPTEDQIRKALQRLFRGLCSGRKAARIGFSIALTEVLAQVFASKQSAELSEMNVSEVVKIFSSVTDPSGGEPGQVCFSAQLIFYDLLINCYRNGKITILADSLELKPSSSLPSCFSQASHLKNGTPS